MHYIATCLSKQAYVYGQPLKNVKYYGSTYYSYVNHVPRFFLPYILKEEKIWVYDVILFPEVPYSDIIS